MKDPYLSSVLELLASDELRTDGPRLISVDELRAAGALDVPAAWRKSLSAEPERDLFSGLLDEDEQSASDETAAVDDPDREAGG